MVKYRQLQPRQLLLMLHSLPISLRWLSLASLLLLGACAKDANDWSEEASEAALYESAQSAITAGNYSQAVARLQTLEARFPFGR